MTIRRGDIVQPHWEFLALVGPDQEHLFGLVKAMASGQGTDRDGDTGYWVPVGRLAELDPDLEMEYGSGVEVCQPDWYRDPTDVTAIQSLPQYEYRLYGATPVETEFNTLGREGWRLVPAPFGGIFVFERPLVERPATKTPSEDGGDDSR